MQGQSQSKGLPQSKATFTAINVRSNSRSVIFGSSALAESPDVLAPVTSIFSRCPCCDNEPVEPVFLDGSFVCRTCSATCALCGHSCLPGDDACTECLQHLHLVAS